MPQRNFPTRSLPRTDGMKTFKVIGLLVLVFLAGFSGGVVVTHLFVQGIVDYTMAHPEKARTRVEQNVELNLNRQLHLTPQQREQIRQILKDSRDRTRTVREEFQPKFNAVVLETRSNIVAVLNPEQKERFEQFLSNNRQFLPFRELPPLPKKVPNDATEATQAPHTKAADSTGQ